MGNISMNTDPWMAWIYNPSHPDYHSTQAQDLRNRRDLAILNAPRWMIHEAQLNDELEEAKKKRGYQESP